jgi:hypothetical protein
MDMRTGEINQLNVFRARGVPPEFLRPLMSGADMKRMRGIVVLSGTVVHPIPIENLSDRVRTQVVNTGKGWVTRNSRCPCGSGKRFKRCCMMKP